jgi:hypothetical protein
LPWFEFVLSSGEHALDGPAAALAETILDSADRLRSAD